MLEKEIEMNSQDKNKQTKIEINQKAINKVLNNLINISENKNRVSLNIK